MFEIIKASYFLTVGLRPLAFFGQMLKLISICLTNFSIRSSLRGFSGLNLLNPACRQAGKQIIN
jgi:hypothetical protein